MKRTKQKIKIKVNDQRAVAVRHSLNSLRSASIRSMRIRGISVLDDNNPSRRYRRGIRLRGRIVGRRISSIGRRESRSILRILCLGVVVLVVAVEGVWVEVVEAERSCRGV